MSINAECEYYRIRTIKKAALLGQPFLINIVFSLFAEEFVGNRYLEDIVLHREISDVEEKKRTVGVEDVTGNACIRAARSEDTKGKVDRLLCGSGCGAEGHAREQQNRDESLVHTAGLALAMPNSGLKKLDVCGGYCVSRNRVTPAQVNPSAGEHAPRGIRG